jgi:tripartite-type tricarboxylate transporter receptor subunit TctC
MTKTKLKVLIVIIILISFVIVVKNKKIENYPQNTIDVIIAYKEGGGTGLLLKKIQKSFPISFNIKNIPGKNGGIGYSTILGAKPDGYTIGVINFPNFLSLSLQKKLNIQKMIWK